jgi:biopolymer transport protein ExbD
VVQEVSSLVIHVSKDNSILINHTSVSPEKLTAFLQAIHAKQPKLVPQLFQDKRAQFGTYQIVKNAVETAGFVELDVVLKP